MSALREGRLEGTKCTHCNIFYYPPRANCKECLSDKNIEHVDYSGEGKILSFSEVHVPPAGFEHFIPYTICVIDLKEGGRLVAWINLEEEPLRIGENVIVKPRIIEEDRVTYLVLRANKSKEINKDS